MRILLAFFLASTILEETTRGLGVSPVGSDYHHCEEKMAEQRETYKGREIVLQTGVAAAAARTTAGISEDEAGAEGSELFIDGERIYTVRDAGGKYGASGFVFDPQPTQIDLAKKIIDYRETGE